MDDALLVCSFERLDNLPGNRQRLAKAKRTSLDPVGKRLPLDELHHQRVLAVAVLDAMRWAMF